MIVIKIHSSCHILNQRTQSHPNTPKIASIPPNLKILKNTMNEIVKNTLNFYSKFIVVSRGFINFAASTASQKPRPGKRVGRQTF